MRFKMKVSLAIYTSGESFLCGAHNILINRGLWIPSDAAPGVLFEVYGLLSLSRQLTP